MRNAEVGKLQNSAYCIHSILDFGFRISKESTHHLPHIFYLMHQAPCPISAKLFCKNLQVAFMPYGVGLKGERPTSNIQLPTSNEKQTSNTERSTAICVSL
jgi:hypothetical protein